MRHGWHDTYCRAENAGDVNLLQKLQNLSQAYWDLYAPAVGQTVFDQYAEEDGIELFDIELLNGRAMRHYRYGGQDEWKGLFQEDLHDSLIVGFADENLEEDYKLKTK